MENNKAVCPKCGVCQKIQFVNECVVFTSHRRYKSRSEEDEGVHLRNITDEECPGSGQPVTS